MEDGKRTVNNSRRKFIQKAVYVAPAVLTLSAMPFTASYGSQQVSQARSWDQSHKDQSHKKWDKWDKWDMSDKRDKSDKWDR
jgi:hypothetical protein